MVDFGSIVVFERFECHVCCWAENRWIFYIFILVVSYVQISLDMEQSLVVNWYKEMGLEIQTRAWTLLNHRILLRVGHFRHGANGLNWSL